MSGLTPEEAETVTLALLDKAAKEDPETAHIEADAALITFLRAIGHERVADRYEAMSSNDPGFWYA